MRKLSVLLSAFAVALTSAAYADLALPGELTPDILDKAMEINGETYHVVRTISKNSLSLKVIDNKANEIWSFNEMGEQAAKFKLNGEVDSLKIEDLDGDNIPEIIAGCTITPNTALYVFKYDMNNKNFKPMTFGYEGMPDAGRDFMVSDIFAENGENMVFERKDLIKTMGKIFGDNGAVPGFYFFKLQNGEYICNKQVPIKVIPVTEEDSKEETK